MGRRIVLLGTPLALCVLMVFHPAPYDDIEGELVPIAGWWTVLHTLQFVLFALMGAALWMFTYGLSSGIALTLSRLAAAIFLKYFDHAFPYGSLTFGSFFIVACWPELGWGRPTLAVRSRRVS